MRLPWTFPTSYGSAYDADVMHCVFWVGFSSWALFAIGWAIRVYVVGEDVPLRGKVPRPGRLTRDSPPDDSD